MLEQRRIHEQNKLLIEVLLGYKQLLHEKCSPEDNWGVHRTLVEKCEDWLVKGDHPFESANNEESGQSEHPQHEFEFSCYIQNVTQENSSIHTNSAPENLLPRYREECVRRKEAEIFSRTSMALARELNRSIQKLEKDMQRLLESYQVDLIDLNTTSNNDENEEISEINSLIETFQAQKKDFECQLADTRLHLLTSKHFVSSMTEKCSIFYDKYVSFQVEIDQLTATNESLYKEIEGLKAFIEKQRFEFALRIETISHEMTATHTLLEREREEKSKIQIELEELRSRTDLEEIKQREAIARQAQEFTRIQTEMIRKKEEELRKKESSIKQSENQAVELTILSEEISSLRGRNSQMQKDFERIIDEHRDLEGQLTARVTELETELQTTRDQLTSRTASNEEALLDHSGQNSSPGDGDSYHLDSSYALDDSICFSDEDEENFRIEIPHAHAPTPKTHDAVPLNVSKETSSESSADLEVSKHHSRVQAAEQLSIPKLALPSLSLTSDCNFNFKESAKENIQEQFVADVSMKIPKESKRMQERREHLQPLQVVDQNSPTKWAIPTIPASLRFPHCHVNRNGSDSVESDPSKNSLRSDKGGSHEMFENVPQEETVSQKKGGKSLRRQSMNKDTSKPCLKNLLSLDLSVLSFAQDEQYFDGISDDKEGNVVSKSVWQPMSARGPRDSADSSMFPFVSSSDSHRSKVKGTQQIAKEPLSARVHSVQHQPSHSLGFERMGQRDAHSSRAQSARSRAGDDDRKPSSRRINAFTQSCAAPLSAREHRQPDCSRRKSISDSTSHMQASLPIIPLSARSSTSSSCDWPPQELMARTPRGSLRPAWKP